MDYAYSGRARKAKQQIVDMALRKLKKDQALQRVKSSVLKQPPIRRARLNPEQVEVEVCLVKPPEKPDGLESEMDEMWRSYFGKKDNPRWLWQDNAN